MPTTLPGLLLWGVPGIIVWLVGQVLIVNAFRDGHRKSPRGLRLTMAGIGLTFLGWLIGLEVAVLGQGNVVLGLVLLLVGGWVPAFLFWLATRPSITAED